MRGGRMMAAAGLAALFGAVGTGLAPPSHAADLADGAGGRHVPRGRAALVPPCRFVPMPEMTITGQDVGRFRPTWVCVSRGLYADTLPPPPPPPQRPWFFWW